MKHWIVAVGDLDVVPIDSRLQLRIVGQSIVIIHPRGRIRQIGYTRRVFADRMQCTRSRVEDLQFAESHIQDPRHEASTRTC
jgi:hypothetical protein